MEKEKELETNPEYHAKCLRILSLMEHPGWKDFWEHFENLKKNLEKRDLEDETDIEIKVANINGTSITVINKDVVKLEKQFIRVLEKEIAKWKAEATKRPEVENGNESRE